ncbi:MAG TPA: hypothetical protein VHW70_01725 [Edaphobacter sp.]|jgi:hypothetical protein|nr:hypothetical protein [Edaphobacter sp.]
MKVAELLLLGLAGWTAIGVLGVTVRLWRGETRRARRGVASLAAVWVMYLSVLAGVSLRQKQKVVAMGEPQCFDEMCFTVTEAEEVPGFLIRDGRRLIRVRVRVVNRGRKAQSEGLIWAYLVDAQGRRWKESPGVNGVGLTARAAGGGAMVSEPVFKVAADATGLGLVLTHGRWQPGVLVIGDSDSWLHRRTVVKLEL